ncbi:DUF5365 family protein [Aquibacillus sediminis]|uniref:DUF5365 family protein n=1 Tax=Aquibacillus sediminis TaxID=2574734 RepID=UPI0011088675|nr:DUF5365 family protein [Aquibacillus sediminis]
MKVITASTSEQHKYVNELIDYLYEKIFPCFFSLEYIQKLKEFELLTVPNLHDLSLVEIMEVTAAIQTITTILEELTKSNQSLIEYQTAFNKNVAILRKYEINFPFQLSDFSGEMDSSYHPHESTFYM